MTDDSATDNRPNIEEAAALREEAGRLERLRVLQHSRFRWSLVGTFAAVVMGLIIGGMSDHLGIMLTPAAILSVAATSFYAIERGRHPAWGLLSVLGLALLNVMPDLNALKLDEIDYRLTGKAPKRESDARLSQAIYLPLIPLVAPALDLDNTIGVPPGILRHWAIVFAPLGLYHAIRLLLDARRQGKSPALPIAVTVWATFLTFVAANLLVQNLDKPLPRKRTLGTILSDLNADSSKLSEATFAGTYAIVRLTPDWEKNAEPPAADVDIALFSRVQRMSLRVLTVPKDRFVGQTLEEYASNFVQTMPTVSTGPTKRAAAGRATLQYELRHAPQGERDVSYLVAFWQTERRFYVVSGWTDTHILKSQMAEMQAAMDAVRAIE